jgi:hypothetical protein
VDTGKCPANREGKALALAGTEMSKAEDRTMPTLRESDYLRLLDHLEVEAAKARKDAKGHERRGWRVRQREAERQAGDLEFVRRVVLLQYSHGFRGGELLPTERSKPKTLCDCQSLGDDCPRRPVPHDFRILPETSPDGSGRSGTGESVAVPDENTDAPTGNTQKTPPETRRTPSVLVSFLVKGEPKRLRFKTAALTPEEVEWVKGLAGPGCLMILRSYDDRLKALQAKLGLKLVDRHDREQPISEAPLTSHTIRRTLGRAMTKRRTPEYVANPLMGWSKRSQQLRRYGELSPVEVGDSVREITDLGALRKRLGRPTHEAQGVRTSKAPRRPRKVKAPPAPAPPQPAAPTTLGELVAADPKLKGLLQGWARAPTASEPSGT